MTPLKAISSQKAGIIAMVKSPTDNGKPIISPIMSATAFSTKSWLIRLQKVIRGIISTVKSTHIKSVDILIGLNMNLSDRLKLL